MSTLDQARIDELTALGGRELVEEMLALVRAFVPERLAELEQAVADRDGPEARKASHAIKSSAANVGATDMREAAAAVERTALDGDVDGLPALLPALREAIAAFDEQTRPRIALVEDNPDTRLLVRRLLGRAGHRLVEYPNGEEAIAGLLDSPPDLVLLDQSLPDVCGGDVLAALRADPRTASLPVIAFTAHQVTQAWIESEGYDAYLAKPIEAFDTFLDVVNRLLTRPPSAS